MGEKERKTERERSEEKQNDRWKGVIKPKVRKKNRKGNRTLFKRYTFTVMNSGVLNSIYVFLLQLRYSISFTPKHISLPVYKCNYASGRLLPLYM